MIGTVGKVGAVGMIETVGRYGINGIDDAVTARRVLPRGKKGRRSENSASAQITHGGDFQAL